jgi:protein-S-isoprenylcysteine O-methyltransferase
LTLFYLVVALAFGSAASRALIVVPVTAVFIRRIRVEEVVLLRGFGAAYASYRARTKRLIPGLY